MKRIGSYTIQYENNPLIAGFGSVAGKKEGEGPLSQWFHKIENDTKLGCETWEQAESKMQSEAIELALERALMQEKDVQIAFGGSSHFCSAERQYRFPLEYGGQRTPTAQWTVTGSGAVVVAKQGNPVCLKHCTIGKVTDMGITDINNMGAAMAPAASDTIKAYLWDTGTVPSDYDLILTGDLGKVGSELLNELLLKENTDISGKHNDCGMMIYDMERQDVHSGGSGCGCCASVLCSLILEKMCRRELNNILVIATGALMSPTSNQQGESIPGIAHLVHLQTQ